MGPNGFWESFAQADVLQHRVAVMLIIVFAVFQYRVETKRVKSMAAALVFPAVCALGGVVLLTHTHAVTNIKEELLAELSHTPLAYLESWRDGHAGWNCGCRKRIRSGSIWHGCGRCASSSLG